MLTGENKSKIDKIWDAFWSGGISDPLRVYDISEYNEGFWSLLRDLFLFDDGYIRYDYDEVLENGLTHPLNHLDIFYSTRTTFKVGFKNRIREAHFMDLLDVNSDCHFLNTV